MLAAPSPRDLRGSPRQIDAHVRREQALTAAHCDGRASTRAAGEGFADTALEASGLDALSDPAEHDAGEDARWQRMSMLARGVALAGGTTQIQKNIIAERVLELPR